MGAKKSMLIREIRGRNFVAPCSQARRNLIKSYGANIRPLSYVLRNKLPPALRSRSRLNLMKCGGELFLRTTILYHPTLP